MNATKPLTATQEAALSKLTRKWASAYELKTSRATLNALVRRGLAENRMPLGSMAFPSTTEYRRAQDDV